MKKVIILIAGYISLGVLITIMQSCEYDAWIMDIAFKGLYRSSDRDVDDLTKSIDFEVTAANHPLTVKAKFIENIDFFTKCYALTKKANWQNDLDVSSFEMDFDKSFIFDSDTIESGKDIFTIGEIKKNIQIEKDNTTPLIICTINFSSELRKRLSFESGEYVVNFSCRTTDGKIFEKSRRVIFCEN